MAGGGASTGGRGSWSWWGVFGREKLLGLVGERRLFGVESVFIILTGWCFSVSSHDPSPPPTPPPPRSDDAVVKGVLLGVVCPVGRGHAAVGVQQDPEAAHDEQGQEDEEQQHEDEGRLLLQRQVGGDVVAPT